MNVYYFLGRLASPAVAGVFYLYSLFTGTSRARLVVRNEDEEVLLLQAWPSTNTWTLPGGGVKQGEKPEEAASRELREETGIELPAEAVKFCFSFRSQGHDELVYSTTVAKDRLPATPPNRWEVRNAEWFSEDSLPKVATTVHRILAEMADKP